MAKRVGCQVNAFIGGVNHRVYFEVESNDKLQVGVHIGEPLPNVFCPRISTQSGPLYSGSELRVGSRFYPLETL